MFNTLINESYNGSLPFVAVFKAVQPYFFEDPDTYKYFYLESPGKAFEAHVRSQPSLDPELTYV